MSTNPKSRKQAASRENYSEAFKREIVAEFETGLFSKAQLKQKYCLAGHSSLDRWLKKYGKYEYISYSSIGRPLKDRDKQQLKELEARLGQRESELEKKLKEKEAELQAYKRFVEIAEAELNISIVKKSGAKQCKK
jgi:transposase